MDGKRFWDIDWLTSVRDEVLDESWHIETSHDALRFWAKRSSSSNLALSTVLLLSERLQHEIKICWLSDGDRTHSLYLEAFHDLH